VRTSVPEASVRAGFIELAEPALPAALASIPAERRAVLVPLLLTSGYHDRVDLPAAIAAARPGTAHAAVLGPDRLLAVALVDRLRAAGWRPGDAVVLAAAGSSDPAAVASVHTQAALLHTELTTPTTGPGPASGAALGPEPVGAPGAESGAEPGAGVGRVWVGFGAGAEPSVGDAVAQARRSGGRVVIAPYLLAPGQFADRVREAGADLVAAPLGAHPAVIELVLQRAAEASTDG
jgi:sirohydrochlorin ferrochelatase